MKKILMLLAALSLVGCDFKEAPETYYTITASGTTNIWHHIAEHNIDKYPRTIVFKTEDGHTVTLTDYILETEN